MNEEQEMSEMDVNTESSSETQETNEQQLSDSSQQESSQEASPVQKEPEVPFHMHPRFQELVQEKNQYRSQIESLAKKLQDLESRTTQQSQPQKDELMERLKNIDPAFAERFGKISEVDQLKQELQEFKEWREQSAQQQVQTQIQSAKDKFYSDNKVPEDRRDLYEALLGREAAKDPSLKISDLPKVMKAVHDNIGKMFQTVERSTAKNFVEGKKAEAAKPTSLPKGAPAKSVNKEQSMSRNELREAIKAETLAEARAAKEI